MAGIKLYERWCYMSKLNTKDGVNRLETEKISKLLLEFSIPTIVAMFVNAIYNVVDRMFIGKYVGENALAGLSIVFPIMAMLFAVATLFGIGGANIISNKIGEKKIDDASKTFGTTITYAFSVGIVLCILSYVFRISLLNLLGASKETLFYAEEYLNIILFGYIFQMFSFILNNSARAEGRIKLTTFAMITSAIINIIFDYIFIGIVGIGVKGAAYATIFAQFIGFLILVSLYVRKKSVLTLKKEYFVMDFKIIPEINKIGFSSFMVNAGSSIGAMIMNKSLYIYGGNEAITSVSVATSVQTFIYMPIFGLRQGMNPIMGYNYGAKKYVRVYQTLFLGMKVAGIFSLISFLTIELYPQFFVSFFLKDGSSVIPLAVKTLRMMVIMLPFFFINVMGLTLFQSTRRGRLANILSLLKQITIVPLILYLPVLFGLNGVILATPICDFISIVATIILLYKEYKRDTENYRSS